jgi:uncharacterized protein (TIGR03067 family)
MKRYALLIVAGLLIAADAKEDAIKEAKAKLKGTWDLVSQERDGQKLPEDRKIQMAFEDDKIILSVLEKGKKESSQFTYTIDPSKNPAEITYAPTDAKNTKVRGIYALEKDELKLCVADVNGPHPKEFATKKGSLTHLYVLKRRRSNRAPVGVSGSAHRAADVW